MGRGSLGEVLPASLRELFGQAGRLRRRRWANARVAGSRRPVHQLRVPACARRPQRLRHRLATGTVDDLRRLRRLIDVALEPSPRDLRPTASLGWLTCIGAWPQALSALWRRGSSGKLEHLAPGASMRQAFGPFTGALFGFRFRRGDEDDRAVGLGVVAAGHPRDPMGAAFFGVNLICTRDGHWRVKLNRFGMARRLAKIGRNLVAPSRRH